VGEHCAQQFSKFAYKAAMPRQLFGYDVVEFLGEGAGSQIYVVSDRTTQKLFALKHVVRKEEKDIRFVEQLEAEFEVSRQFRHPGLRRALDLKINRSILRKITDAALVMELVEGTPLDTKPPERMADMVSVFVGTAQALASLHQMGYVHCDLKPNNILVGAGGLVKVIDFGQTCKVGTVKERIQGTPDYIAPEQVRCEPVSHRTDIFNFGATMYWGLTGQKIPTLFTIKRAENSFLVDSKIPTPRELNPCVPEPLSNMVMDCVRTVAAKRPGDIGEIGRRLEIMHHGLTRPQPVATPRQTAVVA
jgi:serine/threonine-protein kinase